MSERERNPDILDLRDRYQKERLGERYYSDDPAWELAVEAGLAALHDDTTSGWYDQCPSQDNPYRSHFILGGVHKCVFCRKNLVGGP